MLTLQLIRKYHIICQCLVAGHVAFNCSGRQPRGTKLSFRVRRIISFFKVHIYLYVTLISELEMDMHILAYDNELLVGATFKDYNSLKCHQTRSPHFISSNPPSWKRKILTK
jgi:hypothetical protein